MTITLSQIDSWEIESIEEVFDRCTRIRDECVRLDDTLKDVGRLEGWGGAAALAAENSLGRTRVDVGDLMAQSVQIRRAVNNVESEVESVKLRLDGARATARHESLLIADDGVVSEDTSKRPTTDGWTLRAIERYTAHKAQQIERLQADIDSILRAADDADGDLAAAILGATGQVAVYESNRDQTDRDAFRKTFHRDPVTETDWRTAAMLNTTAYKPDSKGVRSEVVVSKIQPVPGQGTVKLGLFIPNEMVFNIPDGDLGDDRGFDKNFGPENTRATVYIDYENGIVITRQNPSIQSDGQVRVEAPSAKTWQLPDGTVMVDYRAENAFAPPGSEVVDRIVRGKVIVTPGPDGPALYGNIGDYPSAEAYSEREGVPTLLTDDADNKSQHGPLLELGSYHIVGERPEGFDELFENKAGPGSRAVVPHLRVDGTTSGAPSDPPQTIVVQ
ncbi:hypothetical protein [Williamsia soli]|uniref:hypothetical protein n=1 Tax=Williamsia soli TaxID=364929 RepID=UPI001A9E8374|nr:hypothetical protein [Williamsia soli]